MHFELHSKHPRAKVMPYSYDTYKRSREELRRSGNLVKSQGWVDTYGESMHAILVYTACRLGQKARNF